MPILPRLNRKAEGTGVHLRKPRRDESSAAAPVAAPRTSVREFQPDDGNEHQEKKKRRWGFGGFVEEEMLSVALVRRSHPDNGARRADGASGGQRKEQG